MALQITNDKLPKDAISLSRSEAVSYQWNQIFSWPSKLEVWSFSWGIAGLGILAGSTAAYIHSHYRTKMKLRSFGHASTSLPLVIAPVMLSAVLHSQVITNDIILKETKCPLCLQSRAATIQLSFGIVYPLILSPLANLVFAIRHGTYRVPHWKDHKGNFEMWMEFTRPLGRKLIVIGFMHIVAASFVTYSEAEHLYKIQSTLLRLQEEFEMEKSHKLNE